MTFNKKEREKGLFHKKSKSLVNIILLYLQDYICHEPKKTHRITDGIYVNRSILIRDFQRT